MSIRNEARGLLPLRRMAARVGVPSKWLREQAEAGKVPGLRAGNRWLFLPDAAESAVRNLAGESAQMTDEEFNESLAAIVRPTLNEEPLIELRNRGGAGMVLLNNKLASAIPSLDDELSDDPMAYLHFFTVTGWQWWLLSLNRKNLVGCCYVVAPGSGESDGDIGTVDLRDLANMEVMSGYSLGVERDKAFSPCRLSEIRKGGEQ